MQTSVEAETSANRLPDGANPTTSPLFCDLSADITFKSSDNVLFKIHSKYLEATSAGFTPSSPVAINQEVVLLDEPSQVLEILFQFIHPPTEAQQYRQPTMTDVTSEILFAVAEAAEKYLVFGAMNVCLSRMDKIVEMHPLEILNHCFKHGYKELADKAALHTITFRLPVVAAKLTHPGLLQNWLVYYDLWMELSRFTRRSIQQSAYRNCPNVMIWEVEFLNTFADFPRCALSPSPVPSNGICPYGFKCYHNDMSTLFFGLTTKGTAIPKFTSVRPP